MCADSCISSWNEGPGSIIERGGSSTVCEISREVSVLLNEENSDGGGELVSLVLVLESVPV